MYLTRRWRLGAALLTSIGLVACGDATVPAAAPTGGAGGGSGSGAGGAGGAELPRVDLAWTACPLYSDGTGPMAECASPTLPLRAEDPMGATLGYHLKRYAAPDSPRTKQLWMLAGGPGSSGMLYEKRAEVLTQADPTLEIYMPDHRGTGQSTRLGCPEQETEAGPYGFLIAPGEWKPCFAAVQAEWGDDLTAFSVTNAAYDVGVLVESARRSDARVYVYGASYGTFWGQRYLQLFPHQADGVLLDAIAPPTASLARQDIDADEASADLFDACVADPGCGPRFPGGPRAFALDLYDRLDQGHCPGIQALGPAHVLLRRAFGQMMMTWNARRLIPAALVRADRCAPADVDALGTLFDYYFLPTATADLLYRQWGWVLSNYIVLSELWETPEPSLAQLAAWRDNAVVSRDVTAGLAAPSTVFTRYAHDAYYGGFADTDEPMLMLQGTWDPATRPGPAAQLERAYAGAHQYWVEIPRGAHGALGSVPLADGTSCGTKIALQFLDDPATRPDTSCLDDALPLGFDGEPALDTLLFGTEDAWGDP